MADMPEDDDDKTVMQTQPPEDPPAAASTQAPKDEGLIGAVINNNYKIQQLISAGGMGEVYRGEQVFTGDPVAIKIVLPALAQDEKVLTLFKREARILSQLADEAIVRYFNFVHDPALDRFCLIMDFIDGIPLSDQVAKDGPITLASAKLLLVRLAKGLDKAHQREVTHRDLSPDNVMLPGADVNRAVLIDFGIAKSTEMTEGTLHGQFAGKFKYISPEQLGHFDGIISPRTDIYGLALLMAAAMRGRAIDMGSSIVEAVNARREIPDLTGIYPEMQPLIAHMLEPDPALRPARMLDVAAMVENPARIPNRYTGGMVMPENVDSDATVITTLPPGNSMPPPGTAPPGEATVVDGYTTPPLQQTTGIQSPPGLSAPRAAPVPPQQDLSQTPFGGGTSTPFATTAPPERTYAPTPIPEEKSGGAGKWIAILAVLAALGGGGWYAMTQGLIEIEGLTTEVAEPEDPADNAQTPGDQNVSMPAPDVNTRQGFLAAYKADVGCTYATRITSGINAGKLEVVASNANAMPTLSQDYRTAFGAEPALVERKITQAQCATADLVRGLQGRKDIEPVVTLDTDTVESGGFIVGRIGDVRGRALWLALVTATGEVFDLSSRLQSQPDGSVTFEFGIGLGANAEAAPQVLVALAASDPVLSLAAITDGEPASQVMPLILNEISAKQGGAAAGLGWVLLTPPG
ncbi:MAG: protein kinase [Aliishimia sp.]